MADIRAYLKLSAAWADRASREDAAEKAHGQLGGDPHRDAFAHPMSAIDEIDLAQVEADEARLSAELALRDDPWLVRWLRRSPRAMRFLKRIARWNPS